MPRPGAGQHWKMAHGEELGRGSATATRGRTPSRPVSEATLPLLPFYGANFGSTTATRARGARRRVLERMREP